MQQSDQRKQVRELYCKVSEINEVVHLHSESTQQTFFLLRTRQLYPLSECCLAEQQSHGCFVSFMGGCQFQPVQKHRQGI